MKPTNAKMVRRRGDRTYSGQSFRSERDDGPFYVPLLGHREPVAVSGNRDQRVAAVAGEQRGRAKRAQLLMVNVTDHQIHTMVRSGWLQPRFPGVYVVGYAPDGELTRETEALLASPSGGLLGGVSCAAAWAFMPWRLAADAVHITISGEHRTRHPGIQIHRTRTLDADLDIRMHKGLPTVSPARALVEAAGTVTPRDLERALDDALHANVVRLTQVRETLMRIGARHKRSPVLAGLVAEREAGSGLSRSDGEIALWEALVASGLPRPERNVQLCDCEVDFLWRDLKVVVEVDSYRWHLSKASFESDRAKDARLEARGYTVLRFTANQIGQEPLAVIARIAAVLARAAARSA